MNKSVLIAAGALVLVGMNSRVAFAQTPSNPVLPWGTWFIGTAQLVGSPEKKWGAWAEVQARTDGVFSRYFKTAFLSVYDEIFLNPKGPVFERNRVYAGLGYQFNDHLIVQAGWVHQANYNLPVIMQNQFVPQNTSAKNNIVLSAFYRLRHRNDTSPVNRLPSQPD